MLERCAEIWDEVRHRNPLVHCMTNYVTMNDVANILLAAGASPAMCDHPEEAGGFARLAGGLYFNLGTLTTEKEQAMQIAATAAREEKIPLLVDPVACGVIPRKKAFMELLMEQGGVTVVKGNGAEIKSLAGREGQARGVDSLDSGEGMKEACMELSSRHKAVVTATGEIDIVANEHQIALVFNGTDIFQKITGAGCMAGAVMTACLACAPEEAWLASVAGLLAFNLAGERAVGICGNNPGSFRILLVDQLYHLRGNDLLGEGNVEWL